MTSEATGFADSHAVLIGVSSYQEGGFPSVPAALNSLQAVHGMLTDPALCGWPRECVTVIADPGDAARLGVQLAELAEKTTGVLLVYYVGHGALTEQGDLCLTAFATRPDGLYLRLTGLPWEHVAAALRNCPARLRLVILDCCFAGQINGIPLSDDAAQLADLTQVQGVYTLTATTPNVQAMSPPLEQQESACTSFTGELYQLIREGMPGKSTWLTLGEIYPALRQRLIDKGLPRPGQRGTDTAYRYPFTRNAAPVADRYPHSPTDPEAVDAFVESRRRLFALARALTHAVASAIAAAGARTEARRLQSELVRERETKGMLSRAVHRVGDAAQDGARTMAGAGAGKIADGLARDRDKALERARALAEEIAANLARANELDRDSDEALARAGSQAAELADALTSPTLRTMASRASRVLAQTRLRGVSDSLDAVQMDVSGRDLSGLESLDAGHLGVLKGVIWTDETRWPSGLAEPIRARSHEIRPGVYQIHRVHGDPTPDIFEVEDPV